MLQKGYRHLPGTAQIIPVFSKSNFRLLLCHFPESCFCLLIVITVNTVLNIQPDQRFFVQKGRKHSRKLLLIPVFLQIKLGSKRRKALIQLMVKDFFYHSVLILLQNYPTTLFTDQSVLFLDYLFGL